MSRCVLTGLPNYISRFSKYSFLFAFFGFFGAPPQISQAGQSGSIEVTLMHTNDLHSQYREKTYPFRIGGVARLKTAISQIRRDHRFTTLVDGGDWSEGSIYYTLGTGTESIRMMDHLGYDFAVVGNHDWLNGPDQLLDTLKAARPRTQFLSYNLSIPESYARKKEFEETILPYQIVDYAGFKIAYIGISTYEFVYDKYLRPIKITNPFTSAVSLASQLKREGKADGVVLLSHNNVTVNQYILRLANELASENVIDLVIGAHDHKKLTRPIEVHRLGGGSPAWVVETGMGGSFLGEVKIELSQGHLKLKNYRLIQLDSSVPQDPETLKKVEALNDQVVSKYGRVFDDIVGESELDMGGMGIENMMGDFVADSYRQATGANIAIESHRFIYDGIHPGPISAADIFDTLPPVYNPNTEKTWTLRTFPMKGNTLKWILYFLFGTKKLSSYGLMNFSGLKLKYDPLFASTTEYNPGEAPNLAEDFQGAYGQRYMGIEAIPVAQEIQILNSHSQYEPLDPSKSYTIATGGGLVESIEFINEKLGNRIPLDELKDTGIENWRILTDRIRALSRLGKDNLTVGDRIRTIQPNVGIYPLDISWRPKTLNREGWHAEVHARIRNYGDTPSSAGPEAHLLFNKNRSDLSVDPIYFEARTSYTLPEIPPGGFQDVTWDVTVPAAQGTYPITIRITGAEQEVNTTNHEATVWLRDSSEF